MSRINSNPDTVCGGGAGSRTRVQNKSVIRSFTSLFGLFPNQKVATPTHLLCGLGDPPVLTGKPSGSFNNHWRPTNYPVFANKATGSPAITRLARNCTQHCRWQLKFVTLSIHVSQLDTCTLELPYPVETNSPPKFTLFLFVTFPL